MNDAERDIIIEVLCSQALADNLGDVRDAENKLWQLIEVPELSNDDPTWDDDSAWSVTKARLREAGMPLPSFLADGGES